MEANLVSGPALVFTRDEVHRLTTLRALGLLDTPAEERFDRITRLAQRIFDVPIALVSFVDEDRQWFKSRQGLDVSETSRESSFCSHAIRGEGVMQVQDAESDPRFAGNPLVLGDPHIRFYAGCPIAAPDGSPLGALCIVDREPRHLSPADVSALADLAALVEQEIAGVQLALDDELTGLTNRRGFLLIAEKVLGFCTRQGVPATVVFADLDDMKTINDRFGHEAGDRAIQEAASILRSTFRASDVLARLGGDEFCALLTGTGTADDALDRLSTVLERRNASDAVRYRMAFSIGTATFDPLRPAPIAVLLHHADSKMYSAKRRMKGPLG